MERSRPADGPCVAPWGVWSACRGWDPGCHGHPPRGWGAGRRRGPGGRRGGLAWSTVVRAMSEVGAVGVVRCVARSACLARRACDGSQRLVGATCSPHPSRVRGPEVAEWACGSNDGNRPCSRTSRLKRLETVLVGSLHEIRNTHCMLRAVRHPQDKRHTRPYLFPLMHGSVVLRAQGCVVVLTRRNGPCFFTQPFCGGSDHERLVPWRPRAMCCLRARRRAQALCRSRARAWRCRRHRGRRLSMSCCAAPCRATRSGSRSAASWTIGLEERP